LTDCFVLDTKTWVWSVVEQNGDIPPATQRYRSAVCGSKIVCVGEKGNQFMLFPLFLIFGQVLETVLDRH
jgi:hypothetical protein